MLRMRDLRQFETADRDGQQYQRDSQAYIRHFYGRCFMQAVGLQHIRRHRSYVLDPSRLRQNEQAAKKWCQEGSERVESLREIESAGCRLWLPEHRHIRIGSYLQAGNPRC